MERRLTRIEVTLEQGVAGIRQELRGLTAKVGEQNGRLGRAEGTLTDHAIRHSSYEERLERGDRILEEFKRFAAERGLDVAYDQGVEDGQRTLRRRDLALMGLVAGAIPAIVAVVGVLT